MASILVVYESKYGQAEKIAEHLAELARRLGHAAKAARSVSTAALTARDNDAVVVVAPVYYGRHHELVRAFLRTHGDELSQVPGAFISVSGAAGSTESMVRAGAERMARAFVDQVGYAPQLVTTAGGAMAYPRYGFFLRLMTQLVSRRRGGPTDTTRIHESTDWDALDAVMTPFFQGLEEARSARGRDLPRDPSYHPRPA